MGLLSRFDISSDFTQFFLYIFIALLLISVLLTRVSPRGKQRGGKVDDRLVNREGELID